MRVFISCDIEGITTTTLWEEAHTLQNPALCAPHTKQMTLEVLAACEGAIAAGAEYILVKDAHGSGTNIDVTMLPECVEVIRFKSGHPYSMAEGVDSSFDAAMFVGYHSAASRSGNPLSHTRTKNPLMIKINGVHFSEFSLYSYACALEGVPSVLLTGDKMLCEDSMPLHPMLQTVAVKEGVGYSTRSIAPQLACKRIRQAAEAALRQDLGRALCVLPDTFTMQISYKEHAMATRMSHFPGFRKIDDITIEMKSDSYYEILRALQFVL